MWSWRAHAGAKLLQDSKGLARATVANAGSPGRTRISRKPLRREGRLSPPVPVVFALAQISFAREPRVHAATRPSHGLPCALPDREGFAKPIARAYCAAGMRTLVSIGKSNCTIEKFNVVRTSPQRGSDAAVFRPKFRHARLARGCLLQPCALLPQVATFCLSTQRRASAPIELTPRSGGVRVMPSIQVIGDQAE